MDLRALPGDGDGPLSLERSNAFPSAPAPSLVAEHEAYERGRQVSSAVWGLLATVGAVAVAAKGVAIFRRRRRTRELLLENLYITKEVADPSAARGVPRCLPTNPYDDPATPNALGLQIEKAAEASSEFDRILGVIFFDLGDPPRDQQSQQARAWIEEVAELTLKLKGCLRATDHVAFINDREIVVCIALLPGRTELVGIANRLRQVGRKSALFASAFRGEAGFAIYPLCGYRGDELIDHARADYLAHRMPAETTGALENEIDLGNARNASDASAGV